MTREEAKREIQFAKRNVLADSLIDKAYDMAIEALTHTESQCESAQVSARWIPCSERLPEKGEKVLASTKNTVFTQVFKGTQGTCDSWWWNNNTIKTICAWMPLQDPYQEEKL